jgi:hypothetical protein
MSRRWIVAGCFVTLVALMIAADRAVAAAAHVDVHRGLELVGSPMPTVRFVAGEGRVVLLIRNVSGRPGRIELMFVSRDGRVVTLPGRTARAAQPVSVRDPQDLRRPLAADDVRRIELRLRLAPDQAPVDGGGRLRMRISSGGPPLRLAIGGSGPDISFDPAHVTIDVIRACWLIGRTCGDSATILMRGRDALLWAHRTRPRSVAILNNRQGGSLTVHLRDVEVRDGAVRVTVDASDLGAAGRYAGRLPIEPNGLAGPSLVVDVKVRWSLAAAVLVIFVGALFGGFFLRRFEIRRRRRLLELELLSALDRYDEERARCGDKPASYDLDHLLAPRRHDQAATTPFPGTRGVSALLWHIKTARDDADFSEDIARTHALISAIERWLALEPVVRDTVRLLACDSPPPRAGLLLSDTTAYRDLDCLRMRAITAPQDDDECTWLIGALAAQGRVAVKCKIMWELSARLESREGWSLEQGKTLADLDVLELERAYPAFEDRAPRQTEQLLVTLCHAEQRLRRLYGELERVEDVPGIVEAHRIGDRLDAPARNPAIERATLDLSPWRLRLAGAFSSLALRSVVWTLARALAAAAAYALTIYSDTWGSVTDFASAFTAGFLTETLVNWAAMPAFGSHRNRAAAGFSQAAPAPSHAGGGPQSAPLIAALDPSHSDGRASTQPGMTAQPPTGS